MPASRPNWAFSCFKCIERCTDRVTGAAGPIFIAVATLLFVVGTLCFRMSPIVQLFLRANHIFANDQSTSFFRLFRGHGCLSYPVSSSSSTCSPTTTLPAPYPQALQVIPHSAWVTVLSGQRNDPYTVYLGPVVCIGRRI